MRKEGKIANLNCKSIVAREKNDAHVWIKTTNLIYKQQDLAMPTKGSFECQSFNPFSVNEDLKDSDQDTNVNFYQTQISSLDTGTIFQIRLRRIWKILNKTIFYSSSKHSQYEQKLWILSRIFRFIMFLIQCYFVYQNSVSLTGVS